MSILRFDATETIKTDLDPIEDLLNFITTLKSTGFTSDLLREIHGFTNASEIKITSKLISLHVDNAISLANQGFDGPPHTSFLPLYYSTLNLSKVYLLFLGERHSLESNRWHGAIYKETEMSKKFMNEKIYIKNKGTIPLLYKTITGKSIGKSGLEFTLNELYQNITSIGAEYNTITKQETGLLPIQCEFFKNDKDEHFLKINILHEYYQQNPPHPRCIKAFPGLHIVTNPDGKSHYETRKFKGKFETIEKKIKENVKRQLNSDQVNTETFGSVWVTYTPISGRNHVLNEELCIMLAYFHLSNVVRYNPEHLYKIMDSKYWAILLSLRKHGFFKFEKLMWGNFIKKSFDII